MRSRNVLHREAGEVAAKLTEGAPFARETEGASPKGTFTEAQRGMAEMSEKFREVGGELYVSESGEKREAID